MTQFQLTASIGFTTDTTLAVARMIYDGFFDRFQKLKIIAGHGGGTLPYLIGRLDQCYEHIPACRTKTREKPSLHARRIYADSVVFTDDALAMARARLRHRTTCSTARTTRTPSATRSAAWRAWTGCPTARAAACAARTRSGSSTSASRRWRRGARRAARSARGSASRCSSLVAGASNTACTSARRNASSPVSCTNQRSAGGKARIASRSSSSRPTKNSRLAPASRDSAALRMKSPPSRHSPALCGCAAAATDQAGRRGKEQEPHGPTLCLPAPGVHLRCSTAQSPARV